MPTWSVHLSLANKLRKSLKLDDSFIIGNVMPDILSGYLVENPSQIVNKNTTHFQEGKPPIINVDIFCKKYEGHLNSSLVKGYLSHLITDKFFNEYTYKNHYSFEDGRPKTILNDGTKLSALIEVPWKIKQSDFEVYGQKLINNNDIPTIMQNIRGYDVIKECPIDKDDLNKTIHVIHKIRDEKKEYNKNLLRMFNEEELDDVYEECYEKIYNILKDM